MKVISVILFSFVVIGLFPAINFGQDKARTLQVGRYRYKNAPVALIGRELSGKPFDGDQAVGGPDWLRNTKLVIKNVSNKNVTFFEIHLVVDNPQEMPRQDSISIRFTGWPTVGDNTEFQKRGGRREILKPGEVITLLVRDQLLPAQSDYLKRLEAENFSSIFVDIRYVHFDDGTRWTLGYEMREDPNRPGSWTQLREKPALSSAYKIHDWIRAGFLIDLISLRIGCKSPASGRFFYATFGVSIPVVLQSSTCRWYDGTFPQVCPEGTYSCTASTGTCWAPEDRTYATQPPFPTDYGQMVQRPELCRPEPDNPNQGACNSCVTYQRDYWIISTDEICNPYGGLDDDCDGQIDEGFNIDGDAFETCEGDCNDNVASIYPGATESCNGIDDNCDQVIDGNGQVGWVCCSPEQVDMCESSLGRPREINGLCDCDHSVGPHTPIVVDIDGDGFKLTNAANGVDFDFYGDGAPERLGWPAIGSDDSFLVLDRNGNDVIDNGSELFGNFTHQPSPPPGEIKNGFLALAVFDQPSEGGNGDGQIDRRDAVFTRLRVWRDVNHNGFSESSEIRRITQTQIRVFELAYTESRRVDANGNQFRYRAIVRDGNGAQVGRWAWDVFLVFE